MKVAATFLLVLLFSQGYGQPRGHSYPRVGFFQFGRAVTDYVSRFDLAITGRNSEYARELKKLNPNMIVLPRSGWTYYDKADDRFPPGDECYAAINDKGEPIYEDDNKRSFLIDITNLAPVCPHSGKRYNQIMAEYTISITDMDAYDGVASDWLWFDLSGTRNTDFDRNGVNDFTEHGRDWVQSKYRDGVLTLLKSFRENLGPDKYLWVNPGFSFINDGKEWINGQMQEHTSSISGWTGFKNEPYYHLTKETKHYPHLYFVDGINNTKDPYQPPDARNYFRLMRFLLTYTMLGDGYFSFYSWEFREHRVRFYYDEFDIELGYPKGDPHELSNGTYVRFFDHGASLFNPTGRTQTIEDSDIRGFSEYAGPYYRFKGGQDSQMNNGEQFDMVELFGGEYDRGYVVSVGDGIILTKTPQIVISDIIIDNQSHSTSPGSDAAKLTGSWEQTNDEDGSYQISRAGYQGFFAIAVALSSDAKAEFAPTIGVPGEYEVFEWHGTPTGGVANTSVSYKIHHANGTTAKTVNQRTNAGRWNSLGTYFFEKGKSNHVAVEALGADGVFMSDAIKFVYAKEGGNLGDVIPPVPPKNVRVKK